MEQVLIREEISPLKKGRKVSGEIMAKLLHLLGSYRQGALGRGVQILCLHQNDEAVDTSLRLFGFGLMVVIRISAALGK